MGEHAAWVYILASPSRTLYTGVTSNLRVRIHQHRTGQGSTFALRYRVTRLVHAEPFDRIVDAITREKQIKSWRRVKKIALIESGNPSWLDLAPSR